MTAELQLGSKIAERYEIREILGEGTLGASYKAYDTTAGRSCVIKTLPAVFRKKEILVKRFVEHYKRLLKRNHEGFARVFDVGMQSGMPYAVIEFLEGLTLRQLLKARAEEGSQFSFEEAESIIEEIGQILSWLHRDSFHGALKPENVFLLPDRIKLTDDGLMNILPPEVFARVQVRNPLAAHYCAPELLSEPDRAGKEVDVFGLAAISYELLTCDAPALEAQGLEAKRSDLNESVVRVIRKAMMDQPGKRYPTINTYLLDLARLGGDKHKVQVLEAVVEAEASEEAERTMSQLRASEAEAKAAEQTQRNVAKAADKSAAKEKAEKAKDVSKLFLDDDFPETLPDMAIAATGHAEAGSANVGESTDLLHPTPTISANTGSGKGPWLGIAIAVVLAAAAAGLYFGLTNEQPDDKIAPTTKPVSEPKPDPAMQQVDQRMLDVVDKAVAAVKAQRDSILKDYPGAESERRFIDANGLLTDAETAKTSAQFDTALQLLRMSEGEFDALRQELAAKAQEVARATSPPPAAKVEAKSVREAVPEAKPKPVVPAKSSECPDGMVRVAAGPYMAGSPADDLLRDATERNYERVEVAAYCIDRYEYPNTKGSRPKVKSSQPEAQKICLDAGKRLCTEHEWEKACKGPRNNFFPYGKVWDPNVCNTETATGEDRTLAPTGSKAQCKSDYDVYDLSGNVLEWTSSSLEQNKTLSIAKGGSYMRPDYAARCAYRYTAPPGTLDAEIGFRCCSDLP